MDLRQFFRVLESKGELCRVGVPVDPKHELGAICKIHNECSNSPALLFENVKGSTIPVVGQLLASDRCVALALGLSQKNAFDETVRRASNPMPTRLVEKGPCQEGVLEVGEFTRTTLSLCTNHPRQG